MPNIYFANSSGTFTAVKDLYMANNTGAWTKIREAYQADSTGAWRKVYPPYPAAGTLIGYSCSGYNKVGTYADGNGGTYTSIVETNSTYCGFVPPSTVTPSGYLYYIGGGVTTYPPGHCANAAALAFNVRFNGTNIQVYFASLGTWVNMTTTINSGSATSSGQVNSGTTYGACWRDQGEYFYVRGVTVTANTISGYANGWDAWGGWRWGDSYFSISV